MLAGMFLVLKLTSKLLFLSDQAGGEELLFIKYIYHGRPIWYAFYNQSGVTELLITRDPYYGRMCFKSVKTLGFFHY